MESGDENQEEKDETIPPKKVTEILILLECLFWCDMLRYNLFMFVAQKNKL